MSASFCTYSWKGWNEVKTNPVSHLEVSLYCMAAKRIPVSLTELVKGLTMPVMKPFTCRKLALPILEEPSTRKTISAACTLLHLPMTQENTHEHIFIWQMNTRITFRRVEVVWRQKLSYLYPELQPIQWTKGGQSQWKPGSTSSQPEGTQRANTSFYDIRNKWK